eukprot:531522-Pyramimonas_sp.AAC.1
MMGNNISLEKCALICSCPALGKAIEERLGDLSGGWRPSAANLGVDDAAGASFRAGRTTKLAKRALRKAHLTRKVRRLKTLRGHFGRKALKVFVSGPLPGYIYGTEVM